MSLQANLELTQVQADLQDIALTMESSISKMNILYDMHHSLLNVTHQSISVESLNVTYCNVVGLDLVDDGSTESIAGTIRAVWNSLKKLWEMIKSAVKSFYNDMFKFVGLYLKGNNAYISNLEKVEQVLFNIPKDALPYVDEVQSGSSTIEVSSSVANSIHLGGKIDIDALKIFLSAGSENSIVEFRNEYISKYRNFLQSAVPFVTTNLQHGGDLTEDRIDDIVDQWLGDQSVLSEWNKNLVTLATRLFQDSSNMRFGGSVGGGGKQGELFSTSIGAALPGNKQIVIESHESTGNMSYPSFREHPRAKPNRETKAELVSIPRLIELARATKALFESSDSFTKDVHSLTKEIKKIEKQIDRLSKDMQLDLGEYKSFQKMYRSILNIFHPRQVKVLHQIMTYEHQIARGVYDYLGTAVGVYTQAFRAYEKAKA